MPKKGYKQTIEHRKKIGKANKIALKGKHISFATEFKKGHSLNKGTKNGNYKDGRSIKKYYCIDC